MTARIGIIDVAGSIVLYTYDDATDQLMSAQLSADQAKQIGKGLVAAARKLPDSRPGSVPTAQLYAALRAGGMI